MDIRHNVSLREYSTMRLGGTATHLTEVNSRDELRQAAAWAEERRLPAVVIGGGSNIIWRDDGFPGLVIVNKIMGFEMRQEGHDFYITVGAGENWDSVVERAVAQGLTGVEALSLVPGTAGATPIQNVGAYGQEIARTLVSVEAYDSETRQMTTIVGEDCAFGYRTSRFKTTDRGRFFITAVMLRLTRANPEPPFYPAVQQYLVGHEIQQPTPAIIREAVIAIRRAKLPDPARVANNGSFFANPVVDQAAFNRLQATYSDLPSWPTTHGRVKLSAAWLLEQAGFKDVHDEATGMATWPTQPLVLVNERATSTTQLLAFRQKILDAVEQKFGIRLEQEPEILP